MAISAKPIKHPTALSEIISERMRERGVGIKELSQMVEVSYEHARRIVRGEGVPSPPVLRLLSQQLDLNWNDLDKLATMCIIRKKHGDVLLEMAGRNPEMESIERAWPFLTKEQKYDAIAMITAWANRSRALE